MAGGEPGWLASTDRSVAHAVSSSGSVVSVVLAITFLLISLAVFIPAATRPALALAVISAAAIWVLTENLGGILTGTGTDPNTGPLLILLATAYWPFAPQWQETAESPPISTVTGQPTTSMSATGRPVLCRPSSGHWPDDPAKFLGA
jgi:hypothetical protein